MRIRAIAWFLACFALACSSSHHSPLGANGGSGSKSGAGSGNFGGVTMDRSDGNGGVLPVFPGAGTSDAGEALPNGMLCDAVAGEPSPLPKAVRQCFYSATDSQHPAATLEQVLECSEGKDAIHLRLTFDPNFVDNTYGENAIGWDSRAAMAPPMMMMGGKAKPMMMMPKGMSGHTFMDLVGSDHAEIAVKDDTGKVVLQFKLDYISVDPSRPSGYGCLGVTGGEGKIITGKADWVVGYTTSLDLDLNDRGYASYTTDSPATDENYTPNKETPEWDYRVVYEAWISLDAFGSAGFGGASIEFVHASPSKASSNTVDVMPNDCPPCGDGEPDTVCGNPPPPNDCTDGDPDTVCNENPPPPDGCVDRDPDTPCTDGGTVPPPSDGCADTDPDTPCTDGGTVPPPPGTGGNGGTPTPHCTNPDDPSCHVD